MTNPIDSPDHVLVCGERVERFSVDGMCASYGEPGTPVRVSYWPTHDQPWNAFLSVTRPSGVHVEYRSHATSLSEALGRALYECTFDDCDVVLRSLRSMGRVAHA